MMKRFLAVVWILAAAIVAQGEGASEKPRRPNILFFFADDLRADTVGAFGGVDVHTPNIDALAARGTKLTQVYCMGSRHGAVCAPSRAMLMTGRILTRAPDNMAGIKTLPQYLRDVGYATFATGKWHNGNESLTRSFPDARSVFRGGMCDHFQVPLCDVVGGEVVNKRKPAGHSSEHFADAVIDFLKRHKSTGGDQPFFAYVPFTSPHDPRDPPRQWMEKLKDLPRPKLPVNFRGQHGLNLGKATMTVRDENLLGWPRDEALLLDQLEEYRALVAHQDAQVGRVLGELARAGFADDTLVVFTADHGLALGSHGLLGKQSLYEHSMRSPCVIAGPGVAAGASRDGLAYLLDLTATCLEAAGLTEVDGVDGRSLWPMLRGAGEAGGNGREELLLIYAKTQRAMRFGDYKLIRFPQVDRSLFFNVREDPHELRDLSGDAALQELRASFEDRLRAAQRRCADPLAWTAAQQIPVDLDLTGKRWPPDRWQPEWIREKYWPQK
jgi:arylsulfatase A-like enzyme